MGFAGPLRTPQALASTHSGITRSGYRNGTGRCFYGPPPRECWQTSLSCGPAFREPATGVAPFCWQPSALVWQCRDLLPGLSMPAFLDEGVSDFPHAIGKNKTIGQVLLLEILSSNLERASQTSAHSRKATFDIYACHVTVLFLVRHFRVKRHSNTNDHI